jgi:hypothetical protein
MSRKVGGVNSKELSKFVKNSYAKRKDAKPVGNYVLDKELSTGKSKVYYDPTTKKSVVAHSGTHGTFQDWKQNINILTGNMKNTKRYKDAEKIQRKANAKYGKDSVETISHSKSGEIARILAKKGLTSKSVSLNPAILGKKHKGVQVVRSKADIVSALTPMGENDVTISNKTYNPLIEHGTSVLSREPQNFGGKYITPHIAHNLMHQFF